MFFLVVRSEICFSINIFKRNFTSYLFLLYLIAEEEFELLKNVPEQFVMVCVYVCVLLCAFV